MKVIPTIHSRRLVLVVAALVAALAATLAAYHLLPDYSKALGEQPTRVGTAVLDRDGRILRLFPDEKGRFGLWCQGSRFPEHLKAAVVAAEDQRFYYHPGFDPVAIARAVWTNAGRGRIVSGASTITQQVVRLIRPRPRTFGSKIIETLESMKMEWQLSKEQILVLHLNLSPMGGNIRGATLASRIYFGKNVEHITLAEAAVLAALPRSPSRLDPRRPTGRKLVLAEKDRILKRMAELGWITPEQLNMSLGSVVVFKNRKIPLRAPHVVDFVMRRAIKQDNPIRTTVDPDLQGALERILKSHSNRLRRIGIRQAAALIVSVRDGEILAMVGSLGYGEQDQGFNNAVLAQRSAGSTLKPFLYALALQKGYAAVSEVEDTDRSYPTPHGVYLPLNADRRSYGPVNIRLALGNSLNMSAIKVTRSVGLEDLLKTLQRLEVVDHNCPPPDYYGLGLAVGNVEVSLMRLVQAYRSLADKGEFKRLKVLQGEKTTSTRMFSPEVAYVISHILADPSARLLTFGNPGYFDFGFPVALKTGTSTSYRDAWTIAYTTRHVVGVWAGNFDGRPGFGKTGSAVCGPIVNEVVRALYGAGPPESFTRPLAVHEASVCSMSGKLAGHECPYTTTELLIGGMTLPTCDLPHQGQHHELGAGYASWLDRREAQHGEGRFRLMKPESVSHGWRGVPGVPLPRSGGPAGRSRIEIISPHDHDRFVLARHRPNRVIFRALPDSVVEHVIWFLDGIEAARTGPPYEFSWDATRGSHVLHAVTPNNDAARVTFQVE